MSWTRLEGEILEASHGASDANAFAAWTLARLDGLIGLDSAIVVANETTRPRAHRNKGPWVHLLRRMAVDRRPYAASLEKGLLAATTGGAYLDTEVFSLRERNTLPFYREIVKPQGITSQLCAVSQFRGSAMSTVYLCRHGGRGFRPRELERLRRITPLLSLAEAALSASPPRDPLTGRDELTPRERQIVGYLCRGFRNQDIAVVLGTSTNTVRNQIQRLFEKTRVASRAELVAQFLQPQPH